RESIIRAPITLITIDGSPFDRLHDIGDNNIIAGNHSMSYEYLIHSLKESHLNLIENIKNEFK
ncbi:MAG: hypothetical protein MHPSP_004430, partial [Paramarteilia canceri]